MSIIQRFFINAALRACVAVYYLSCNSEYFHVVCFVALYRHCCCFVELFSCVNLQSSRVFFCAFVVAKYLMSRNVLLRLALLCKLHQTHVSQTFYTRVLLRLASLCKLHQTRVHLCKMFLVLHVFYIVLSLRISRATMSRLCVRVSHVKRRKKMCEMTISKR